MIEKENLIKILEIWNYWTKKPLNLKVRENYEKKIKLFSKSKEVIVLKGIRRSGKSTLLNLEIQKLLKEVSPNNILFVNFEEPKFISDLNLDLLDYIYQAYLYYLEPKGKVYIFLDEVQNIFGWEKWVLRMYEKENVQIYVTGSSSKLLSSEFSTALSGRHLSINVYPLSFKEFLNFKNLEIKNKLDLVSKEKKIKKLFEQYLLWGGFPKISEFDDDLIKKNELISYYDTIILKDIAKRHEISNISDLKDLSFYLLSNIAKPYSINNLKNLGKFGAYETIKKYIDYIKETYLLFDLDIYDVSVKKQLVNPKKIYAIDTGILNTISFKFTDDIGRLLENLVFLELKRRGNELYYHKDKHECDFVIKEGLNIVSTIQVTKSLSDLDTKKRELNGLIEACEKYKLKKGLILTLDEEFVEIGDMGIEIRVMPIWKWLLEN